MCQHRSHVAIRRLFNAATDSSVRSAAMPRSDRLTLTRDGLEMPPIDQLSNNSTLNVVLDGLLGGIPVELTAEPMMPGLFINLCRLTDKALREYDASRASLLDFVAPNPGSHMGPYLRATDHMENCVSATHRAVLNLRALCEHGVGRKALPPTKRQEQQARDVRNAIEHSDEKLLGKQRFKHSPPFDRPDPYSLRLSNGHMVIGKWSLSYKTLVVVMTKCHGAIEVIRRTPTGSPGPSFPMQLCGIRRPLHDLWETQSRATTQRN